MSSDQTNIGDHNTKKDDFGGGRKKEEEEEVNTTTNNKNDDDDKKKKEEEEEDKEKEWDVWRAAAYGNEEKLEQFTSADRTLINATDANGFRPLQWAALNIRVVGVLRVAAEA